MRRLTQFWILLVHTFISKFKKNIGIGIIAGFLITLLINQSYPLIIQLFSRKHVKIGYVGIYNETNLPLFIQNQISLGLTSLTPSGEATPSLAYKWDVDTENLHYNFYLYDDLTWHDGKKFTAQDVNLHLNGASFNPVNDYQIKVSLKQPYAPLPVTLSKPLIEGNLNGLGLYKIKNIIYKDDFISQLQLQSIADNLPSLTYIFYPTTDEAVIAFKLGQVDTLQNIINPQDLDKEKNVSLTENTLYDRYVGLFFNLRNPLFKEKEVRQALNYATPKFEQFEKVYSPISVLSWAYSNKVRLYKYDPESAQKLLAKSQLASSSTQLTITTYASLLTVAQSISDAWNKIGIKSKVRIQTSIPSDYDLLLITQMIPPDPDQYLYWQSTQESTNISHYNNPKIDKLLEDGRNISDKEQRKKIYADFQRYLVEDTPVIFLYYPKVYTVERK